MALETETLTGVPIFDVGTWNGTEYTDADLDGIANAFAELRGLIDPPAKLGHDEGQKLLQEDGYPAAGWVERLYRNGTQLVADFALVPKQVAELIRAGAYRKVSCEIWFNVSAGGTKYPRVLAGVAFLGEDMPAVATLGDIVALYGMTWRPARAIAPLAFTAALARYSFANRVTYTARIAPMEERRMATQSPSGFVPAVIIGIYGLAADASPDELIKRILKIEGAASDSLTTAEGKTIGAVRAALGLSANASTSEVVAKLRGKLVFVKTAGGTTELVFENRHRGAGERADHAMSTSVLKALGLPADAEPHEVLKKVTDLEEAKRDAETAVTNEAGALESLRNLLGLDATATDDDIVAAIREYLQSPAIVDQAILTRKLAPAQRAWAETFAAKQGVAALRTFVTSSGPFDVRADEILTELARERVRWSRGRLNFTSAMEAVARDHPEITRDYLRTMQRQTRTSSVAD
jgi:hypothetical protein